MKVQGSFLPPSYTYEVIEGGNTALIRFYENAVPHTEEMEPEQNGYIFDCYTVRRPHTQQLQEEIAENTAVWKEYVKREEWRALAAKVRSRRNRFLLDTDWTQVEDAPVSQACKENIRSYRQALRDITEQEGFPYLVDWPQMPIVEKKTEE